MPTVNNSLYSTRTLLGAYYDDSVTEAVSNYWLGLCFPGQINFETEYVDFSKLSDQRKMAPLVVPTTQGRPMYSAAEERVQIKPAYVKPKDAVSATRVIRKVAGLNELNFETNMSPAARYNLLVADILNTHRRGIERRWEWLASEAIQFGKVTLEGEAYPRTVVDFKRDPGHDITLTTGNRWGDTGVSILKSVEGMRNMTRRARYGGVTNRLTVGAAAWEVMQADPEIRELLNTDIKAQNNGLNLNLGMREGNAPEVEYVGNLSGTVAVYVYSDYYEDVDGSVIEFMDPRDVVLTGPGVQGVRCFGAIQDKAAGWVSLPVFPKMWDAEDPSATFIMTQSAPLMVPTMPNASARARVRA
jgi:uncharacterized protein YkwD